MVILILFIGFGSMVIDDSSKLVNIVKEAAATTGTHLLS